MDFIDTTLYGAYLVKLNPRCDERGFFARSFCQREFESRGLIAFFPQSNISRNNRKHTLRGMHFRKHPNEEAKIVRCIQGSIQDVIIDLRPKSPTYRKWESFHLTAQSGDALYIPKGYAHGFITLEDATDVLYQMSEPYVEGFDSGIRWNDKSFEIIWPTKNPITNDRDNHYPDFST